MSPDDLVAKRCPKKKAHSQHRWWSRRQKCYFHCFGRATDGC